MLIQQKFYGSGILITYSLRRADRRISHPLPQFFRNSSGRRFLQHLLVASLNGTVTFSQMDDISILICHNLKLDMPWLLNILFNIHRIVRKSLNRLHLGILEICIEIFRTSGDTHALSSAA